MHVRVDKTGKDVLARSVDNLGTVNLQVLADFGNGFIFDIEVGFDARFSGDDLAVFDQQTHIILSSIVIILVPKDERLQRRSV